MSSHQRKNRSRMKPVMPPHLQQHAHQHQIREEDGGTIHDESDTVSFKNATVHRFSTNQEYMETITSKNIHVDRIIPPSSFPEMATDVEGEQDADTVEQRYRDLKPNDIYVGDLELMKIKARESESELEELKSKDTGLAIPQDEQFINEEYSFQKNSIVKLNKLFENLNNEEDYATLKTKLDEVLVEYKTKFDKSWSTDVKRFSNERLSSGRQEAPADYNPKQISNMLQQQFQANENDFHTSDALTNPALLSMNGLNGLNGETMNTINAMAGINMADMGSINDLANLQAMNMMNTNGNGMSGGFVFGADDLIMDDNFGGLQDQDFLSQIDHSME